MKDRIFNWVTLSTASVCGLVMLFTAFAIYTAGNISEQAEAMYRHPYLVKSEAQAMRTRLVEMRLYLLPFLLTNDREHPELIYKMLEERDQKQDVSFGIIKEHYLGSPQDVADLWEALIAVRAVRRQSVLDCAAFTRADDILAYMEQNVYPHSYAVDEILQRIMNTADAKVNSFRESAESSRDFMNMGAYLLCALLVALVIFINLNEKRKNKAIAYRDQLFSLLSSYIDDVFFIYDCENEHLEYVSENSWRLLGASAPDLAFKAANIDSEAAPDPASDLLRLLRANLLQQKTAVRDLKYNRNGAILDLQLSTYPVALNGKPWRLIAVLSDQTRMVAQQAALSDALISARKVNDAKQEFLSRMSHEIRTPMNAVIGMTAIAGKYLDNKERVADCLSKIDSSSKHLLSLINDVLDIAKIEGGKLAFSYGPFNLRGFIKTLTSIIYPQTTARQQSFEITISGLTEENLIGDELRLNQILINLLSNAIKFTPAGGSIRLEITRLRNEKGRTMLRFVVRDTGIGMSQAFMERLYTPFEQADNIAQHYGGTGLGLSITKNLISLMHGDISVQSEIGKGTVFTLELPFELQEQNVDARTKDLGDLNVLVVDDDKVTCEHAMTLLEQIGTHGDWVSSGAEAVEKVALAHNDGQVYDVCFIDWRMPEMDGVETARRLRRTVGADTPIIIISSYDWTAIEQEARAAGVNSFISKPLFASSLRSALSAVKNPEEKDHAAPQTENYDFNGKKILLGEDNPLNQEVAVEILQSAGFLVDCAKDGQETLDMFLRSKTNEYDLILMDVQMPRMNGLQSARAIRDSDRADARSVRILAMTANAFNSDVMAAREAGMDGHLAKPIDVTILLRTLAEQLTSREAERESESSLNI